MSLKTRLPEIIRTDRLVVRHPRPSDADAVFAYASDPEVTLHMDWATHAEIAQSHAFLETCDVAWSHDDEALWAITRPGEDRLLGVIGVRLHGHKADFGYALARAYWGRGIATEAARAVVEEVLRRPTIARVWATCSIDNIASRRVLEKTGLECEGILRRWSVRPQKGGNVEDAYCFSIVR